MIFWVVQPSRREPSHDDCATQKRPHHACNPRGDCGQRGQHRRTGAALRHLRTDSQQVEEARAIARGSSYVVIPWQMALVGKALRLLPNALYDRLLAGAPRKPRGSG